MEPILPQPRHLGVPQFLVEKLINDRLLIPPLPRLMVIVSLLKKRGKRQMGTGTLFIAIFEDVFLGREDLLKSISVLPWIRTKRMLSKLSPKRTLSRPELVKKYVSLLYVVRCRILHSRYVLRSIRYSCKLKSRFTGH